MNNEFLETSKSSYASSSVASLAEFGADHKSPLVVAADFGPKPKLTTY